MFTLTHRIWLRFRSDVQAGMRFRKGTRIFAIGAWHDPDETRTLSRLPLRGGGTMKALRRSRCRISRQYWRGLRAKARERRSVSGRRMMSAANELLAAIHARLSGDAGLAALIGADGIRDRQVAGQRLPCIVIGEMTSSDSSTASEAGEEHLADAGNLVRGGRAQAGAGDCRRSCTRCWTMRHWRLPGIISSVCSIG